MSTTSLAIVQAAVEAAKEELQKQGLEADIDLLPRLFYQVFEQQNGMVNAILITKSGSSPELVKAVRKVLEAKFRRHVDILEKADASIIGGAILQFGDERIDLSVRGSLERLSESLISTNA